MANPVVATLQFQAAVANGIALSQAVTAAGNLTLNGSLVSGGVATFDAARRVAAVSSSAGDTTQSLTITGTDRNGNPISEVLALNGTTSVYTQHDFLTVSQETASAALAGNITSGTNGVGSSAWIVDNPHITPFSLTTFARILSGSATYTLEYTPDDPQAPSGGYTAYPVLETIEFGSTVPAYPYPDPSMDALSQTIALTVFQGPVFAHRYTINSGTGKVLFQSIQAGIHQ